MPFDTRPAATAATKSRAHHAPPAEPPRLRAGLAGCCSGRRSRGADSPARAARAQAQAQHTGVRDGWMKENRREGEEV